MRIAPFVFATFVVLAACGGAEMSQANNAQANIANAAVPTATAAASVVTAKVSGAEAARVMHERHEGMETIGKTTKALKRELDSASPNVTSLRAGAAQIADLSRKASGWFPAGTGPDVGKTGAKPEIWQNPEDFAAKLHNFQVAAKAFNTAGMSGDVGAIKARFGELGSTCKACHDKYRKEMHH